MSRETRAGRSSAAASVAAACVAADLTNKITRSTGSIPPVPSAASSRTTSSPAASLSVSP